MGISSSAQLYLLYHWQAIISAQQDQMQMAAFLSTIITTPDSMLFNFPFFATLLASCFVRFAFAAKRTTSVPVFFNVMHDGAEGNVSLSTIQNTLAYANEVYKATLGLTFDLANVTYHDNVTWFRGGLPGPRARITRVSTTHTMRRALYQGNVSTLNVYSTWASNTTGLKGLAALPDDWQDDPKIDGVVVGYNTLTGQYRNGTVSLGHTLLHEIAHYMGLGHIFVGSCEASGDYVTADVPLMYTATGYFSGCPAPGSRDTCPTKPGKDLVNNHLDYLPEICYGRADGFTLGQIARMKEITTRLRGFNFEG